ncbi:MAG TPA: ABC transporter permease [Candidatus Acidoferrales bacterium]|nr:ABC transporter permease [Candidatus Acidoferrales bacterium]
MRTSTLLARNLAWFWRTNLAVLLGVATATAVLAGALLVGDSVRASLRHLVLGRLGNTGYVVSGAGFFREKLADDLGSACPMIALDGVAAHEPSGRRAAGVQVYGVDERFWKFQGEAGDPPHGREVLLSAALARELTGKTGDTILLRVQKPSAIPLESLHGRKENVGQTIRLAMSGVARHEFSLRPQQGDLRAVYVPLARLQRDLAEPNRVNTILSTRQPDLKQHYLLEDLGLRLRDGVLNSESGIIPDAIAAAAESLEPDVQPVLTYLANSIRIGGRAIPYSLVTALEGPPAPPSDDGITLNEWAARELRAKPGDVVTLEYYVWKSEGRLDTATAGFRVAQVVPITGLAAARTLAPEYPGITDSENLHDWDPPFPMDLSRIRPADEQYWKQYRATPKAFVRLARGRQLWATRFGSQTSIRKVPPDGLRNAIHPAAAGLVALPVRARALEAARGATDFGEYFVYFSFFLVVSALMLTGLFFKLGVEQRMREIGILRALGFPPARIRTLFLLEGAVITTLGTVVGVGAALAYGALILYGLRTWWVDAVGTRLLTLHASPASLIWGALGGAAAGLGAIAWTLRRLQAVTPRGLVAGEQKAGRGRTREAIAAAFLALVLIVVSALGKLDQTAGFFGAGALLLIAALLFEWTWLLARGVAAVHGQVTLGLRSAAYRPGRSILCIALIASATFVIVSLAAFQREGPPPLAQGYPLMAESVLPLIHSPAAAAGREALNIPTLPGVEIVPFRLRPGDDASCLNLYQPRNPRILAWPRLDSKSSGGTIPAIADANSLEYVLHRKVGEGFDLNGTRFQIVDALHDSIFQSELLIPEKDFLRLYPNIQGFRFFLLKAPPQAIPVLEEALSDYGFVIESVAARLASFHRVENTYLATFRALGGLGLVLGTIGLAAILLRNVLERRKELALLRATGFRARHLAEMVMAENLLLLLLGLATGTACALLAVAPALGTRGGHLPLLSIAGLLAAVAVTGAVASLIATAAVLHSPLLAGLRSE